MGRRLVSSQRLSRSTEIPIFSDCQGYGCQQGEPQNVCSEINDCLCAKDVWFKTKAFCTVLKSCAKAKEDYEMARQMVVLYTGVQVNDVCLASIQRVVCSYHFPVCLSDQEDYQMICYDTCLQMYDACNITLPYFASVGSRCHFERIWNPDPSLISERAVRDGNKECTAAGSRALAGCISSASYVYTVRNETRGVETVPLASVNTGDRILTADRDGNPSTSRVIFLHTHEKPAATVRLYLDHTLDYLELTPSHMLPIAAPEHPAPGAGIGSDYMPVPLELNHSSRPILPPPSSVVAPVLVPAVQV
eukprot:CAMPEP_0181342318 /NCGR_PEP_ID=MMETSP1101-20121128/30930_1 /TAXON_ID=46948 /ORGANISM="Rhodomonas abbreviata, Strain Caron Lab Isolate" /LENGTH=304 /DNA_ID=CAMNT_0023453755 /DNA_START=171 /DNA_END=1082 /DNA_ORIENTATION=-